MKNKENITEALKEVINNEKKRYRNTKLLSFLTDDTLPKTNYSLPLKDTIGRTLFEKFQFRNQ